MATTLREYRKKRDFQRTPEPSGGKKRSRTALRFVVQKHAASRLHYDFRLELDGVLKSWAVPKGPSYNPADKRLAVEVEDHPLEYATFEGVIPEGEYGGGTVMVWDEGTWEPQGDARAGLKKGKVVFTLHGRKLNGQWTLVRSRTKDSGRRSSKPNWLLIKKHDEFARDDSAEAWIEAHSRSAVSERTMEEIRGRPAAVWSRNGRTEIETPPPAAALKSLDAGSIKGAKKSRRPAKVAPQLATLADTPPKGDDWLHEVKFDGYRLLALVGGGKVRLITRSGKDWTQRFAGVADAVSALGIDECVLDGEVVVLDAQGRSQFQLLQNMMNSGQAAQPIYYVFDLLHLGGYDLTGAALTDRKALLAAALERAGLGEAALIRYSDHIVGQGEQVREQACEMQLEGIVSKRADSKYRSRRTRDWIKSKCVQEQEFIIIGYTRPGGSRTAFGALLLGYHDRAENLVYAGRVGTGFTERSLRDLHAKLKSMARERAPVGLEVSSAQRRGVTWVEPQLVAEVTFQEWTGDGRLRHPVFHGLREDKPAKEIVRETPAADSPTAAQPENTMHKNGKHKNGKTKRMTTRTRRRDEPVVGGVALSHPDRVLYPDQGITKRQLAEHYDRVADLMLPHLLDRPLALVRCPEGQGSQCFFQKHYRPDLPGAVTWIESKEDDGKGDGKVEKWISVSSREGLISLAQIGVLEVHPWGSRRDRLDRPDRMILDLDPGPGVEWGEVVALAHDLHERLADIGLETFVKTTGGKGLHVVAPLTRRSGWDEVKDFAHAITNLMAREQPSRYVSKMTKSQRHGRIYIDYLRNGRGATAAAPYSPRARAGAPVSMPVSWKELTPKLTNDQFTIASAAAWLNRRQSDPWKGFDAVRQSISASRMQRLASASTH